MILDLDFTNKLPIVMIFKINEIAVNLYFIYDREL